MKTKIIIPKNTLKTADKLVIKIGCFNPTIGINTNNKIFDRLFNLRLKVKYDFQCGLISKKTKKHQIEKLNKLMEVFIK